MKVKMNQRMMKMVSPQRRKLPNLKKIAAMKQRSSIPIMKSQPIIHFLTPLYEIDWTLTCPSVWASFTDKYFSWQKQFILSWQNYLELVVKTMNSYNNYCLFYVSFIAFSVSKSGTNNTTICKSINFQR